MLAVKLNQTEVIETLNKFGNNKQARTKFKAHCFNVLYSGTNADIVVPLSLMPETQQTKEFNIMAHCMTLLELKTTLDLLIEAGIAPNCKIYMDDNVLNRVTVIDENSVEARNLTEAVQYPHNVLLISTFEDY